jgi:hypothetical protein
MIIDSKQAFADGQVLTATAVSTNVIDLGVDRNIGPGEHMAVMVSSSVDAGGTTPTLQFEIQTSPNENMSGSTVIGTSEVVTSLLAGQKIVLPLGLSNERYLRLSLIAGGSSPTHTIDAYLQPYSMVDAKTDYNNNYDIV